MKTLEEAIKERDEFLEEHPELKGLQEEIDETLAKTPGHMRMEVLNTMMFSKANELKEEMQRLQKILEDATNKH